MKKSLYDFSLNRLNLIKNAGFDYEGKIFEKTISPYIYNEEKRRDILTNYEKIIYFLIEKTKYIKTFYNYTVPKDYKHIN